MDTPKPSFWVPGWIGRLLLVLAGIILGQAILYGPSLVGRKVLLPLDILSDRNSYLPLGQGPAGLDPAHMALQDLVYLAEPARLFAISELRAGRLPMWNPHQYAGAPCIWPKFSPFLLLQCCTASPIILAWTQLLAAIVAGLGAYLFCRRTLDVGFWPAAIVSWCYPLTGFFVFWQGFATCLPVYWLPWLLLAVDRTVQTSQCRVQATVGPRCRAATQAVQSAGGGVQDPKSLQTTAGSCGPVVLWSRGLVVPWSRGLLQQAAPIGLSLVTCLVVISGQLDIAVQVLLVSGLYAAWRLVEHRWRANAPSEPQPQSRRAGFLACRSAGLSSPAIPVKGFHGNTQLEQAPSSPGPLSNRKPRPWLPIRIVLRLALGWGLGLLLAAPAVLPVVEYVHSGIRMERRAGGEEDRPPGGLSALPAIVLPDLYGRGVQYVGGVQSETSAAGYAGLVATLVVAPLAWFSRRHRRMNLFWVGLLFFSLSWCLNIPGFVHLLRLPGLRMLSHNRWVFAGSFAVTALAATGLEQLFQGTIRWQRWCWAPTGLLAALCLWSSLRALDPPEPLATQLEQALTLGQKTPLVWIHSLDEARALKDSFFWSSVYAATWCGIGVIGWMGLWMREGRAGNPLPAARRQTSGGARGVARPAALSGGNAMQPPQPRPWPVLAISVVAALLVGDFLWFACGRNPQCDPALYYPPIPVLKQLAALPPGRILGVACLPANLATVCGLRDIRGYDAVDPAQLAQLTELACHPAPSNIRYALMQWLPPKIWLRSSNQVVVVSPILSMLDVRYLVFHGNVRPKSVPILEGQDYSVIPNASALDRVYVPKRVVVASDSDVRLQALAATDFDPREVAYVESELNLPSPCRGQAAIVKEIPTKVIVSANMETDGLLVLADLWDKGWRAYLAGKPVPILRTNHALRGVVVPKGNWTLEFRYEPLSFALAVKLSITAALLLLAWFAAISAQILRSPRSP